MSIFDIGRYRREIDLSNRFCASVERNFNSELEHHKRELETISAEYLKIAETVKSVKNFLSRSPRRNLPAAFNVGQDLEKLWRKWLPIPH